MRSYYLPALRLSWFSCFKRKRMELSVVLPLYSLNLKVWFYLTFISVACEKRLLGTKVLQWTNVLRGTKVRGTKIRGTKVRLGTKVRGTKVLQGMKVHLGTKVQRTKVRTKVLFHWAEDKSPQKSKDQKSGERKSFSPHNRLPTFFYVLARLQYSPESEILASKSPLMQDWVFRLGS